MKRFLVLLCICAVCLFVFISCGKQQSQFAKDRDPDLAPWAEDPVQTAIDTKTLRFYTLTGYDSEGKIKGDCTLIVFPGGTTMLVDSGVTKCGSPAGQSLNAMGITHIDYLVLTHAHDDHAYGALKGALLDYITVGQCFYNGIYNDEWSNLKLTEEVMARKKIPLSVMTRGDVMEIDGVKLTVISPDSSNVGQTFGTNAQNNMSIVFKLEYGNTSALMTGDMHMNNEEECVKLYGEEFLDVDFLKIAHHGMKTSTSKDWINITTPSVAVCIGSGSVQSAMYTNLAIVGCKTYMDTIDGYMRVVLDGENCIATVSKVRETDYYEVYDKIGEMKRQELAGN